jgi:hypothetical protein
MRAVVAGRLASPNLRNSAGSRRRRDGNVRSQRRAGAATDSQTLLRDGLNWLSLHLKVDRRQRITPVRCSPTRDMPGLKNGRSRTGVVPTPCVRTSGKTGHSRSLGVIYAKAMPCISAGPAPVPIAAFQLVMGSKDFTLSWG